MNTVTNTPRKILNKLSVKLVRLHASRILLIAVIFIHFMAILAIIFSRLPFNLQQIAIVLLFTHMGYYFHRWRKSSVYRLQALHHSWQLVRDHDNKYGADSELRIEHCYYWSRWLVILLVEDKNNNSRHFPIFYDSCSIDEFHYIRIVSKTAL